MSELTSVAPEPKWVKAILPRRGLFSIPWRELWAYRDLIWLMGMRDISATYKQTVLGPFWFVLQPILTTATFSFLFGRMAGFGSDHIPHFVFYMTGLVVWNYFADCVNKTSQTFTRNAQLFGKVYFPRMAAPLANMLSGLVSFVVQFGLLALAIGFYLFKDAHPHLVPGLPPPAPSHIEPTWHVVLLPLLLAQAAMLAIGIGFIVSALTTRYKDLSMGVGFGVQLWMYGSSIIYPLSLIDPSKRWIFYCNPMVPIIEGFRFALLGHGIVEKWQIGLSFGISATFFTAGIMMFNRVEQTVMDTV